MTNLKQMMLGNAFGRMALSVRANFEIFSTAYSHPEQLGFVMNDYLATRLITRLCEPQKTFIDVGAHIGSIIAAVCHHDPSITIIGVEAIPDKVTKLRQKFPNIEIHSCAVGEAEGTVSFYVRTQQSGYSSLIKPQNDDQDCAPSTQSSCS